MIFDKTFDVLSRSMDLSLVRHTVTADNIANAETPYFKARRVEFEKQMQRALQMEDSGFQSLVGSIEARVFEDPLNEVGNDLNSVDMDREMSEMTKNDLRYASMSQAISKKFALLHYAIGEGRDR